MVVNQSDISLLERELQEGGFSNLDNSLFDLTDERLRLAYQELKTTTKPEAYSRDTTSWDEIREFVGAHTYHTSGTIIIVSGAAPHIWGAIPDLEKMVGARYISATSHKLGVDLVANEDLMIKFDNETPEQKSRKALDKIQVQMRRALGVVKSLGYDTIEDYIADRNNAQNPRNVILGAEETGLHGLYLGKRDDQLHKVLFSFIKKVKTTSILYIHEDLNVENMRRTFEKGSSIRDKIPRDEIFDYAKTKSIPIEFGAFGHRDRKDYEIDFPLSKLRF